MIVFDIEQTLRDIGASLPPEVVEKLRGTHPEEGNAMCNAHDGGMSCCVDHILAGADQTEVKCSPS